MSHEPGAWAVERGEGRSAGEGQRWDLGGEPVNPDVPARLGIAAIVVE